MALPDRPTAITVIGWGAIVVAVLMAFSGAMGALASSFIGETNRSFTVAPPPLDFVIRHFSILALAQVIVATLLGSAGWALLHLRRWGARIVEAFAALATLYVIGFTVFFVRGFRAELDPAASTSAPLAFSTFFGVAIGFNVLFWCVPLVLTIFHIRSARIQRSLT